MSQQDDPRELNDPALLAEIEAEFAELTREIERISAMPRSMAPEKSKLLQALKASWKSRFEAHGDRPEWRQRLDASIGHAVDRLLEEGLVENADGSLAFNLRGDILQTEGGPVLRGLVDGLVHMLEEKFPAAAPGTATPGAAPTGAAPTEPMQALLGGLSQALAGALKGVLQKVATSGAGAGVDVKVAPGGAAQGAPSDAQGVKRDATPGAFSVSGAEAISASFEFDTRKQTANQAAPEAAAAPTGGATGSPPPEAPTEGAPSARSTEANPDASAQPTEAGTGATAQPPPKAAAEAGAAANAFFQQLMQGFGQVMQQAVAKPPGTSDKAAAGAPASNPLAGLGAILSQVMQRAATSTPARPPAAATDKPAPQTAEAPVAPPTQEAAPAPASSEAEAAPTATTSEKEAAAPSEEPRGPVVKIDFAGLLAQILGNKKP